ncbi:MAG: PAQR family membrane homeostasis protein TrhA [Betaproteobacteria bacterium]
MSKKLKDPASGLSHLVGALLSIAALVVLVRAGVANNDVWKIVSFSVFGSSLVLLYSASATYHLLNVSRRAQVVLRKLDHIMIFVLIAGTYTPVCLLTLRGMVGYVLLAVVWTLALAGLFFKIFYLNAPRWAYTAIYLLMGWLVVAFVVPLVRALSPRTMLWLFVGGLFYSVGAVIYGLKRPNLVPGWLGFHEVFHVLILLGSASHFYFVYLLA